MLEINIPLQQATRRSQEAEAGAMGAAAQKRLRSLEVQLQGDLAEHKLGIDSARASEALLTDRLLPQAELGLRAALAAYESGKVDFATLLEAQRLIRKSRQDLLGAQVESRMRLAEMERIVGEDL